MLWDVTGKVMYWMPSAIWDFWIAAAGVSGIYGSPVDSPSGSAATGWSQPFSKGQVIIQNASGSVSVLSAPVQVSGVWLSNWSALGGAQGRLGFAVSGVQSLDSRWSHQEFASGHLLWDATGKIMYWLPNAIWDFWIAAAGVSGIYGSPVDSPLGSAATGWSQPFSKGQVIIQNASGTPYLFCLLQFRFLVFGCCNWSALGGGARAFRFCCFWCSES